MFLPPPSSLFDCDKTIVIFIYKVLLKDLWKARDCLLTLVTVVAMDSVLRSKGHQWHRCVL